MSVKPVELGVYVKTEDGQLHVGAVQPLPPEMQQGVAMLFAKMKVVAGKDLEEVLAISSWQAGYAQAQALYFTLNALLNHLLDNGVISEDVKLNS